MLSLFSCAKPNLFGAVLELRRLPDDIDVLVGDLALDGQEVEQDVRLLDDLHVKVRTEDVIQDPVVQDPGRQLEPDVLGFDDRVGVAHLVEEGYVRVDLSDSGKPHGQGGRTEVLEGQLEAVLVEGYGWRPVAAFFGRSPQELGDLS